MMDMSPEGVTDADRVTARKYRHVGTALITLAFVAFVSMSVWMSLTAYAAGQHFGQLFFAWMLMGGVAWLSTRERSDLVKAKGRMVVGILLCLTVVSQIATSASERRVLRDFMRDAIALGSRQEADFVALNKRFDEITVLQYASPQSLASPQSMVAAQASLEQYRTLLRDRRVLLQAQIAESQAFVNRIPSGAMRRGAESAVGANIERVSSAYEKLDAAQRLHADSLGALFDWARAHGGQLAIRGNQLILQTAQQQAELSRLASQLQDAEDEVNQAVERVNAETEKVAARRENAMKEAASLMGN
jgi:hypothetical protein